MGHLAHFTASMSRTKTPANSGRKANRNQWQHQGVDCEERPNALTDHYLTRCMYGSKHYAEALLETCGLEGMKFNKLVSNYVKAVELHVYLKQ